MRHDDVSHHFQPVSVVGYVPLSGYGSKPAYVTLERAKTHGVAWQVDP
jgi:hypothetical protein